MQKHSTQEHIQKRLMPMRLHVHGGPRPRPCEKRTRKTMRHPCKTAEQV